MIETHLGTNLHNLWKLKIGNEDNLNNIPVIVIPKAKPEKSKI